ncbi:hypothetical protein ACFYZ9_17365 [Streptomyces sp. NPDC001691]|uniref:hypothetical protein n=1 Tax=unclassified Streptomyces TaxID=2593676 RepID=UPI00167833B1|nr:hypothetical protein [Streptomyces sp. SDr-06]
MRARIRSIAALLLPVAASLVCVLAAPANTPAQAHQFADAATGPVPSGNSGDGFSWG